MSEGALLRFANEEMIYLLRALHLTNFPGLDPEPLKELADSEKSLLMLTTDHTLRARGLIHWRGQTEREVDPLITRILQECARPAYTLFVDALDTEAAATQFLYIFGSEVIVEQSESEPQVQQYLIMPSREGVQQRLQMLLDGQQTEAAALPDGRISQNLWMEALTTARTGGRTVKIWPGASLPEQTATALAEALRDFRRIRYLALWKQTPTSEQPYPHAALTIVASQRYLILLWLEPGDSSLRVISARADQVRSYVSRLVALTRQ